MRERESVKSSRGDHPVKGPLTTSSFNNLTKLRLLGHHEVGRAKSITQPEGLTEGITEEEGNGRGSPTGITNLYIYPLRVRWTPLSPVQEVGYARKVLGAAKPRDQVGWSGSRCKSGPGCSKKPFRSPGPVGDRSARCELGSTSGDKTQRLVGGQLLRPHPQGPERRMGQSGEGK
jgi:hypothetical protein